MDYSLVSCNFNVPRPIGNRYSLCFTSDGKSAAAYKGVDIATFKKAISNVESRGSGDYKAIGVYVDDGAGNIGRGLGKYQFMSYGPAKDIINSKPGGAKFLAAMQDPSISIPNFSAQVDQLFTPAEQEALMDRQVRRLADLASAQGLTGDSLLRRMAEMHVGGESVANGVDPAYSSSVIADYKKGGIPCKPTAKGNGRPGFTTGKFGSPLPGSVVTEEYLPDSNNWRGRPHRGTDFAGVPFGTPILAVDGGTVAHIDFDGSGYGHFVVIDHGNGFATLYGHMVSKPPLAVGQPIA